MKRRAIRPAYFSIKLPSRSYFFSGTVVFAGEAAGLALVSGFFSSFFSSFLSSFAGLAVGEPVVPGLEVTIGDVTAGETEGVEAGRFGVVVVLLLPAHAAENAANAAKTVNRIDLLILIPYMVSIAKRLSEAAAIESRAASAVSKLHSQMHQ